MLIAASRAGDADDEEMDVDRDATAAADDDDDEEQEQEQEKWVDQENRRPRDTSSAPTPTTDGTPDQVEVQRKTLTPPPTTGKLDLAPDGDVIISSQLSTQIVASSRAVFCYTATAFAATTTSSLPSSSEDIDMV